MKTLTLLLMLFFCSTVVGQRIKPMTEKMWNDSSHSSILYGDWWEYYYDEDATFHMKNEIGTFFNLILDYFDECYADSAAKTKYLWRVHDWGYDGDSLVDNYWEYLSDEPPNPDLICANCKFIKKVVVYSHKEPTFIGFIEYIERKYMKP